MQWTLYVYFRPFVHQYKLNDRRVHLRVMGKKVRVSIFVKHEELNNFGWLVFNCKVQVRLPHFIKTFVYIFFILIAALHYVKYLDELLRLVVLYELKVSSFFG